MSGPTSRIVATGPETLELLLRRLGESEALQQGRVFVDGRRAHEATALLARGNTVEIFAARVLDGELRIIRVDRGLAFVDKPAGMATEPEKRGSSTSVVHRAAALLGVEPFKVHALSRLDVGVSGVVLLGLEPEAQKRVQAQRERGLVRRRYVAIAAGVPNPPAGEWADRIGKSGRGPLRALSAGGEEALTRYRTCGEATHDGAAARVLALEPKTGRTHQLRVHAAAHGAPFFGDRSYGGPGRVVSSSGMVSALSRVFLHAAWVALPDSEAVRSEIPPEFEQLWATFGGLSDAFVAAVALDMAERDDAR